MDDKKFKQLLYMFCENYQFTAKEEYAKLIYKCLKQQGVTEDQFEKCVHNCIYTKKRSDFYGLPALADWLDMLGLLKQTTLAEDRCETLWKFLRGQCYMSSYGELVKDYAQYEYIFADKTINDFIDDCYGSIRKLTEEYIREFKKGEEKWLKKEILEKLKQYKDGNKVLTLTQSVKQLEVE
ncbi:MAG: hypothetical protein AMJ43_07895 [Coxiella sp. DG_40]|nr:MAG: hypothetical protein AMJ43_07895 [Coxiella sp. DG_40]